MRAHAREHAVMSPLLPPALVPVAGLLALVLVWPRLRRPSTTPRLFVETVVITGGTIASVAALWAALWWIEQRW